VDQQGLSAAHRPGALRPKRLLLLFFLFSLPLLNPWVRGDGVGYYAYARAPLIEHNFDFAHDYLSANTSFREARIDEYGQPKASFRTRTGHLDNHFSVGPAILWSPFLLLAHGGVLLARAMGSSVTADGFSAPYRITMAFATALYAFLGLLISFRLARNYVEERWALLATIAIWWASSLPVYMYFNPSWSHAHAAFAVAVFLWYWHETRGARTLRQWLLLGALAGLMLNVYYANAMVLAVVAVEAVSQYLAAFRGAASGGPVDRSAVTQTADRFAVAQTNVAQLLCRHLLFGAVMLVCLLPTFLTRWIVYGGPFESGYVPLKDWLWKSPVFLAVLFSSNHGLLAWTPILLLAVLGLFYFWRREPRVGTPFLAAALAFYLFISCYPDWAGISSFGNRFFVSLTPLFIVGLAVLLERFAGLFRSRTAALVAAFAILACFMAWNAGLMFQWGTHLVPARGPVSFREMAHNQFSVVPRQLAVKLQAYLFQRKYLMQQIEQRDIEQMKTPPEQ
jgi:hypothetical protein